MTAPLLGPSERAAFMAFVKAVREEALCAYRMDSENAEEAAQAVIRAADALLAAEPEAADGVHWSCAKCGGYAGVTRDEVNAHLRGCQPPAAPAPDAELEKLLYEMPVERSWADHVLARIREHVERREAAARGEVLARGVLDRGTTGVYCRLEHIDPAGWDVDGSAPVLLVRDVPRAEQGYYPRNPNDCDARAAHPEG